MYTIRKVIYEPIEVAASDLMTLSEAARVLGLTLPGVANAVARGQLSEIVNSDAVYQKKRLVLKSQVEQLKQGAG